MDWQDTYNIMSDLPDTFQRFGPIYKAILLGFVVSLARNNISIDQFAQNLTVFNAKWGWLDVYGKLYGILRNQYETDPQYRTRLQGTLSAPHGSPLAISQFIQLALSLKTYITENFTDVNYQINFNTAVNTNTLQQVANAINWVRPAGIPFLPLYQQTGGLFLDTINFFNVLHVSGTYLAQPHINANVTIAANTDNPISLLPSTYLTDPFITGQAS